jgi:hypothetical protein
MMLWVDRRIGGVRTYRLLRPGEVPMQVPDEIRKCVCFIYSKEADGSVMPRGTAFFVSVPRTQGLAGNFVYLVTARHVLAKLKHRRPDGEFLLRLNAADGEGVVWVDTQVDAWRTHPDDDLVDDTAVLPWAPPLSVIDFKTYPLASAVTDTVIQELQLGIGEELFLPGLFVNHTGKSRNIPIVRTGTIAAMPDESISSEIGPLHAYLAEARSIGGLSGSPVFVSTGPVRNIGNDVVLESGRSFYLLGLMHGHYRVNASKTDTLGDEAINMGIAIVLPVARIIETINQPEVAQMREREDAKNEEKLRPVADSAEPQIIPESEYERFEDLTRKLVNTPKKKDES